MSVLRSLPGQPAATTDRLEPRTLLMCDRQLCQDGLVLLDEQYVDQAGRVLGLSAEKEARTLGL